MLRFFLAPGVLLSIERDKKYDAVWIGVPAEPTRRHLYLWEVRPDATWHDAPLGYRLRSITIVKTEDHYLEGLADYDRFEWPHSFRRVGLRALVEGLRCSWSTMV